MFKLAPRVLLTTNNTSRDHNYTHRMRTVHSKVVNLTSLLLRFFEDSVLF